MVGAEVRGSRRMEVERMKKLRAGQRRAGTMERKLRPRLERVYRPSGSLMRRLLCPSVLVLRRIQRVWIDVLYQCRIVHSIFGHVLRPAAISDVYQACEKRQLVALTLSYYPSHSNDENLNPCA